MLGWLQAEFAIGVLVYAACLVDDLVARRWRTVIGRQLIAAGFVILAELLSLLAVARGVQVPPWVFLVGFGATDAVAVSWLVLRLRTRSNAEEENK